jgi:hypothetical protein
MEIEEGFARCPSNRRKMRRDEGAGGMGCRGRRAFHRIRAAAVSLLWLIGAMGLSGAVLPQARAAAASSGGDVMSAALPALQPSNLPPSAGSDQSVGYVDVADGTTQGTVTNDIGLSTVVSGVAAAAVAGDQIKLPVQCDPGPPGALTVCSFSVSVAPHGTSPYTPVTDNSGKKVQITFAAEPDCSNPLSDLQTVNVPLPALESDIYVYLTWVVYDVSSYSTADRCYAENAANDTGYEAMSSLSFASNYITPTYGGTSTGSSASGADAFTVVQEPSLLFQGDVMPYLILYQPPGDQSLATFETSKSGQTETDFSVTNSSSNTTSASTTLGYTLTQDLGGVFNASESQSWDNTTTQTNSSSNSTGSGVRLESSQAKTWSSYVNYSGGGLLQLDQPGTQPWMFDQYVLEVHPQFAVWDDLGTTGKLNYALIAAQPDLFDVPVETLLSCAEGTPLPVPGNANPPVTLSPQECTNLLKLDPFAVAGIQSADPTSALGSLAQKVQTVAAGAPGLGTNGTFDVNLSEAQTSIQTSSQSSSYETQVDSVVTNSYEAGLTIPLEADGVDFGSVGASVNYSTSTSTGTTLGVSYDQSSTSETTVATSTQVALDDVNSPIDTTVWLDTRWMTFMYSVPGPTVSSVTPTGGLTTGGTQITLNGTGFWSGPVGVNLCPTGGGACTPATGVTAVTDHQLTATTPELPAGSYGVQVETAGGPSCQPGSCPTFNVGVSPTLSSSGAVIGQVTPATGPNGGGTAVTLIGSGLAGTSQVWFGTLDPTQNPGLYQSFLSSGAALPQFAPATQFQVVSDGEILACAPPVASAGTVWISVYGPSGWSEVGPSDQFTYTSGGAASGCNPGPQGPPTVTSVSPNSGPGGVQIAVVGSGFGPQAQSVACTTPSCPTGQTVTLLTPPPVEVCDLSGSPCLPATNVQLADSSHLTAEVPAGTDGATVDVRVGSPQGFSPATAADEFTYSNTCSTCGAPFVGASPSAAAVGLTAPTITAVTGKPGLPVIFTTDLGSLSTSQAVYTASDGTASVNLTSGAPGTATVSATVYAQPQVQTASTTVDFYPVPVVTGMSTHQGSGAGGTPLTITGSGFTGATSVSFGSNLATGVRVLSDTELTATSPPGAGIIDVRVANPAVESGTSANDRFTYGSLPTTSPGGTPPAVTGLSPSVGPEAGGNTVTITGSAFTGVTSVSFGATAVTPASVTDTQIQVVAPAGSGIVPVTVAGPGGSSAAVPADLYTYVPNPTVNGLSTVSGPVAGQNTVIIGGTGLGGVTAVDFGTAPATIVAGSASPDEIEVTVPRATAPGLVDVTVTAACAPGAAACGTSVRNRNDLYNYLPLPAVTSVTPATGSAAGGVPVAISGLGFATATGVKFGGVPATSFQIGSDEEILAVAPALPAGTVNVTVTTACAGAQASTATSCGSSLAVPGDQYTAASGPILASVTPAYGPATGGGQVTIQGTGLSGATAVYFGSTSADSFSVGGDGTITAVAPAASPGTVDITVATPIGTSARGAADHYTYVAGPVVTGISPAHGMQAGGTVVTITGSGLGEATGVDFGSQAATQFTVLSDTEVTAVSPAGTGIVPVSVTTPAGTSPTSPLQPSIEFTYYPAAVQPVVRTLQPGWNTLSIPFPLANPDLRSILGSGYASLGAAYTFENGHWRWVGQGVLSQPMSGLFLYITGSSPVTATLTPDTDVWTNPALPPTPGSPTSVSLSRGWNLVGPSAAAGMESYADFVSGGGEGGVPLVIDPNGTPLPVSNPAADGADFVRNGYAYWVYATGDGTQLVGQILTTPANRGSDH